MTILGWSASDSCARARYRTLPLAALYLACALSYTRASAPATPVGADTEYPIRDVRELLNALINEDPKAQKAAQAVIAAAKPETVIDLMRYGHRPAQQEMARRVVVKMGCKAVPTLMNLLGDKQYARHAGSVLFQVLEPADAGRIPDLIACAEGIPEAKGYCAQSIVKISGPAAAAHVPALTKALESGDPLVRAHAAAALGRIGKGAAAARPALTKLLNDAKPDVRAQAKAALKRVGA